MYPGPTLSGQSSQLAHDTDKPNYRELLWSLLEITAALGGAIPVELQRHRMADLLRSRRMSEAEAFERMLTIDAAEQGTVADIRRVA